MRTVEFEYNGYYVIGSGHVMVERNYGADADGNRGVAKCFVDDLEFTVAIADTGRNVTEEVESEVFNHIEELVIDKLIDSNMEDLW